MGESTQAVHNIPEWMLAYAAGYFDGEGTVTFIKNGRYKGNTRGYASWNPKLSISSTDEVSVFFMQEHFGGRLWLMNNKTKSGKPIHQWGVHGRPMVHKILTSITPYLLIKKKQATLMLEFINEGENKGRGYHLTDQEHLRRLSIVEEIKRLKKIPLVREV